MNERYASLELVQELLDMIKSLGERVELQEDVIKGLGRQQQICNELIARLVEDFDKLKG